MTAALIVAVVVLALALAGMIARRRPAAAPARPAAPAQGPGRILFPFLADALSRRSLDAALRLARAEDATLLPVFLAQVPRHLPLDAPLPRQARTAITTLDAIEERAAAFGVPVDARVQRGRTSRHALREAIATERFDRIVIAAAARGARGFVPDEVAWLLATAPGEILVLRPGAEDALIDPEPEPPSPTASRRTEALPPAYS